MKFNQKANVALNAGGLAIHGSSSALVKTANTVVYEIDGVVYTKTAADLAALTGYSVATGYTSVLNVFLDSTGTASYVQSTAVANTASVTTDLFANEVNAKALIGRVIIKNATGSAFTGGTTALDVSNLTVTYVDVYAPASI